jgi:phenylacetate-CoA ligase
MYIGPGDRGWRWATTDVMYARTGFRPGDRLALFWGTHLEPTAGDSAFARLSNWMLNQRFFNCFRLDASAFAQAHDEMESFRPAFIQSYASALALFARFLSQEGIQPRYPTRAIITGAEKLTAEQRELIERVFRRPVFETYGSRECGLMASQEVPGGPFVIPAPYVLLEPHGPVDETGSREVLVTHLRAEAMPLLRYRIGDRALFPDAPVGCAYELQEITGRVLEHLTMPSGRLMHATQFPHLLKDYDVVEYQVTQEADGAVEITLVPGPSFGSEQREKLASAIRRMIVEVPVRFRETTWIERTVAGKLRPVVSHYTPVKKTLDGLLSR